MLKEGQTKAKQHHVVDPTIMENPFSLTHWKLFLNPMSTLPQTQMQDFV